MESITLGFFYFWSLLRSQRSVCRNSTAVKLVVCLCCRVGSCRCCSSDKRRPIYMLAIRLYELAAGLRTNRGRTRGYWWRRQYLNRIPSHIAILGNICGCTFCDSFGFRCNLNVLLQALLLNSRQTDRLGGRIGFLHRWWRALRLLKMDDGGVKIRSIFAGWWSCHRDVSNERRKNQLYYLSNVPAPTPYLFQLPLRSKVYLLILCNASNATARVWRMTEILLLCTAWWELQCALRTVSRALSRSNMNSGARQGPLVLTALVVGP